MSEPFIGEIIMFGGNFAPRGWSFCEGQLLNISSYTALFSILGTTYGGDGRTTFALPDLRGRSPMHHGQGAGLPNYGLGQRGGIYETTLTINQLPAHSHTIGGNSGEGDDTNPSGRYAASSGDDLDLYANASNVSMGSTGSVGNNLPVSTQSPYLAISFIIALTGTFPSRS